MSVAGDWIKVRKDLHTDPAVLAMADTLKCSLDDVVGRLVRVWCWCDSHVTDGNARGVTAAFLTRALGNDSIVSAMVRVGWLRAEKGGLVFPNFDRHLSQGAKNRALTKERVQKFRNAGSVISALPEKRREEKILDTPNGVSKARGKKPPFDPLAIELPESLETPEFRAAWREWVANRAELRKRLTPGAVAKQIRDCEPHGSAIAVKAINRAIGSGWSGLFPESELNGGARHGSNTRRGAPIEATSYTGGDAPAWDG